MQKKRELGYATPHIEWQFIVMQQNEDQMEEAGRLAADIGVDSVIFKNVDFPQGMNDAKEADRWLPREHPDYLRDDPFVRPYQEDGRRCWRLWRSAVVNWDGGVAPCCYLTDKSEDFGDVTVNSIKEIWNNEDFTATRGLFNDQYTPQKWVGCMSCSVYLGSRAARKRGPTELSPEPVYATSANGGSAAGDSKAPGDTAKLLIPLAISKTEEHITE